jgi:hypothetical protein
LSLIVFLNIDRRQARCAVRRRQTVKVLGMKVPSTSLVLADEVIE